MLIRTFQDEIRILVNKGELYKISLANRFKKVDENSILMGIFTKSEDATLIFNTPIGVSNSFTEKFESSDFQEENILEARYVRQIETGLYKVVNPTLNKLLIFLTALYSSQVIPKVSLAPDALEKDLQNRMFFSKTRLVD